MYPTHVVRRDFKAGGEFYAAGTIIEDVTLIPLFKIRIGDRLMVPIPDDEEALANLCHYFQERISIDLRENLAAHASKGLKPPEPIKTVASEPPTPGTPVPPLATGGIVTDPKVIIVSGAGKETVIPVVPPAAPSTKAPTTTK